MSVPITAVIEEAIRYEQALASLYHVFGSHHSDDAELWWKLSLSEEEHAMLLESGRRLFKDEFSSETVPADLEALRQSNESLESTIARCEVEVPSREETFRISLGLENQDNELTLHRLLRIAPTQPASEIVERIRDEDATHEQMIREYVNLHGIAL